MTHDTPAYEAHVLADNPYHYYRFNEASGGLIDHAGSGSGTLVGAIRVPHEGLGHGLRVGAGVGWAEYATDEFSAAIRAGDEVVIELWVRGLVDNASQYLATITNESGDTGVVILNDSTGGFIFQFAFGNNGYVSYLHENAVDRHSLDDGAWHHVAAVLDPVALSVMWIIDGAPDDSHLTAYPYGDPSQIDLASFTAAWGHMGALVGGDPPDPYYGDPVEIDELLLAPYVSVARITERYEIIHPTTEPIYLSAQSDSYTTSDARLTRRARLGATSESVSAGIGAPVRRIEAGAASTAQAGATASLSRAVHLSAESVTTTGASLQASTAIRLRATAAAKTGTEAAVTRQILATGESSTTGAVDASLSRVVRASSESVSHTAAVGALARPIQLSATSSTATSASLQAAAPLRLSATTTVTSSTSAGLTRLVQPTGITEATSSASGALARRVRLGGRNYAMTAASARITRRLPLSGVAAARTSAVLMADRPSIDVVGVTPVLGVQASVSSPFQLTVEVGR